MITEQLDYEALSRMARENAKAYAERMYPPDMLGERRSAEQEEYIRLYRQYTGANIK